MIIRAADADVSDGVIQYSRLADALYPAAATAAKRRRTLLSDDQADAEAEVAAELEAREAWENKRDEILTALSIGSPDDAGGLPPPLVTVRSGAPGLNDAKGPGPPVYAPP